MAQARELIESRDSRIDADGRKTTIRVYHSDLSPELAIDPANSLGLPQVGDKLPWDVTQEAYDIQATYEAGSAVISRIVVLYSNDPPVWGGNTPGNPDFKGWDMTYYRVSQPIPYAVKNTEANRWVKPDGQVATITEYPVAWSSVWESRKRFIRHVRVAGVNSAMWNTIGDLSNKLVKVYSRWYVFTLGDVFQRAANVWDTMYTFEYDPGTPNIYSPPPDADVFYPLNMADMQGLYPGQVFCRPPYHRLAVIPGYDQNMPWWPEFVAIPEYEKAETGHLSLPGIGPL